MTKIIIIAIVLAAALGFAVGRWSGARPIDAWRARAEAAEHERDAAIEERDEARNQAQRRKLPAPPDDKMGIAFLGDEQLGTMANAHRINQRKQAETKLALTPDQNQALTLAVDAMDAALTEPLSQLDKLGKSDQSSTRDWASAMIRVAEIVKQADEEFRASLSPQQRALLEQNNFQITSQASTDNYWRLTDYGAVQNNDDDGDDDAKQE